MAAINRIFGEVDVLNTEKICVSGIVNVLYVPKRKKPGERTDYGKQHTVHELIFKISGAGRLNFFGKDLFLPADSIGYLPAVKENGRYYVDCLEAGECIDIFFQTETPLAETGILFDALRAAKYRPMFYKLLHLWERKNIGYYTDCMSLMYRILSEVIKDSAVYTAGTLSQKLRPGLDYIHTACFLPDFSYAAAAQACGYSYSYFQKSFCKVFSVSPAEYVLDLRMKRACELLSINRLKIGEVAAAVGFQDIFYFSKVFKAYMGCPPSRYAAKH